MEDIWLGRHLAGLELKLFAANLRFAVRRDQAYPEVISELIVYFREPRPGTRKFSEGLTGVLPLMFHSFEPMAAVWFCPAELPGECNLVLHADNKVVNTAQFSPDGWTLRFGGGESPAFLEHQ